MYAILRAGGKQVKVAPGDVVRIEKPSKGAGTVKGQQLKLTDVVFAGGEKGEKPKDPKGITVTATVVNEVRGPKIIVFKKKRTKQYRRTKGHRQPMLDVRIESIEG